jgi:hypothetical protein
MTQSTEDSAGLKAEADKQQRGANPRSREQRIAEVFAWRFLIDTFFADLAERKFEAAAQRYGLNTKGRRLYEEELDYLLDRLRRYAEQLHRARSKGRCDISRLLNKPWSIPGSQTRPGHTKISSREELLWEEAGEERLPESRRRRILWCDEALPNGYYQSGRMAEGRGQ